MSPSQWCTIGTRPILWHLMKYYAHFGHKDFILCLGYKGNVIKDYFLHYDESVSNDFVWSQGGKKIDFLNRDIDDWTITFVETGANANDRRAAEGGRTVTLHGEDIFLANYGDGLSDVPLPACLTTFQTQQRHRCRCCWFNLPRVSISCSADDSGTVTGHSPRSTARDIWINGGFFVMRKEIFSYIRPGDELVREPFQRLIEKQALLAYKYNGFWQCMDTFKDKQRLEDLNQEAAPWKVWRSARGGRASEMETASVSA